METVAGTPDSEIEPRKGMTNVVVMPDLRGLRVVEAETASPFQIGELICWAEVSFKSYQGAVTTFVSHGNRNTHPVIVRGGNRGDKLARRLKERATWMERSDPVFVFAPKRESVRKFWIGSACFGLLAIAGLVYFSIRVLQLVSGSGWVLGTIGFVGGTMPAWLACLVVWSIHRARPRSPQYDQIGVSVLGFRLERDGSHPIECEWQEVTRSKRFGHDPMRLRLDLVSGSTVWLSVPKRVRRDVMSRVPMSLGGFELKRKETIQPFVRQAIRFLILGIMCALGALGLMLWLRHAGLLLPAQFQRLVGPAPAMFLLPMWYMGLALLWIVWRNSPKGRRAFRRWSRSVNRWTGCVKSRKPSGA